jgi:hypothetical protein
MANTETDKEIQSWLGAFDQLPKERREAVAAWLGTQRILYETLGVAQGEWWGYIEWALKNPLDYSFIDELPAAGAQDGAMGLEIDSKTKTLLGTTAKAAAPVIPDGKDEGELKQHREAFQNFMRSRSGGRKA